MNSIRSDFRHCPALPHVLLGLIVAAVVAVVPPALRAQEVRKEGPKKEENKKEEPKKEEPKKVEAERYLQFSRRGYVELQKTRGIIDVNGSFTIEVWVRWSDKSIKSQFICGDGAHANLPEIPVNKNSGWQLVAGDVEDADYRRITLIIGRSVKGKEEWFPVQTSPMKGTDGKWHHIAVSKSPTMIRIFWNGKLAAEKNCAGLKFNGCPSDFYLGTRKGAHGIWGFEGDIRAFRAYSKAVYTKAFKPEGVFQKNGTEEICLDFTGDDTEKILDLSGKDHIGLLNDVNWVQIRKLENK